MPQDRIPFGPIQASGLEELAGAAPICENCIVDKSGAIQRRPALTTSADLHAGVVDANGIDALHFTDDGKCWGVGGWNAGRRFHAIGKHGSTNKSTSYASLVWGQERPIMAHTEALVLTAAGSFVQKYDRITGLSDRLGGTPPEATHVTAQSQRLAVNVAKETVDFKRSQIWYSGFAAGTQTYAGHETWTGVTPSGYVSAESRPDPIVALWENTNELFAWGSGSLQVYSPDPAFDYAPAPTREHGCIAPYSIIKVDQAFAWLDDRRRFVVSDGRNLETVSEDIQSTLDAMTSVADCFGYRVQQGNVDCCVWTFPKDGRTFVFRIGGGWSQWKTADGDFPVTAHALWKGRNYIGIDTGYVGEFDRTSGVDSLGAAGNIPLRCRTGFIDHKTDRIKQCCGYTLTLRRGQDLSVEEERVGYVRYRDDIGNWSEPLWFDLGRAGDATIVERRRSLGSYRRRQWEFVYTGSTSLVLVEAKEEYVITGR